MGWNYLSIHKLQRLHRWSLGMDKQFHPTLYWTCDYLSMLGLKFNHVSKRDHRCTDCVWWNNETRQMICISHHRHMSYTIICLSSRPIHLVHQRTDQNFIMFIERRYFCMWPSITCLSAMHVNISVLIEWANTISRICLIARMLCILRVQQLLLQLSIIHFRINTKVRFS